MRSTTRSRLAVLVAVTSLLTVLSPASAGPVAAGTPATDAAFVEQMMYATSMADFVRIADARAPIDTWFDWTTDWCSAPLVGSTGRSFDFRSPCRRHDFGYRNLQLLERRYGTGSTYWNAASRERVDRQLRTDMKAHCRTRPWHERYTCLAWADTFYAAVRVAGGP
jgi:hypothetical protein